MKKADIEEQLYQVEQKYLEETTAGNIIKGFDNYIKGAMGTSSSSGLGGVGSGSGGITPGGGGSYLGSSTRRRGQVVDSDRVFSRSSASFMRVCLIYPTALLHFFEEGQKKKTDG